jgi:predicted kinase
MEELEDLYNLMVQSKLTKNSFSAFKSEFESSADYRKQIFNTIQSQKGITKLKAFSGANIATFENRYINKTQGDFVSSIPGLKEKLVKTQETKTPKVSVSSPKKTTATKVEEPITGFKFPEANYRYKEENGKAAWSKSTDGDKTFEVVDATNIPESWSKDPQFKLALAGQKGAAIIDGVAYNNFQEYRDREGNTKDDKFSGTIFHPLQYLRKDSRADEETHVTKLKDDEAEYAKALNIDASQLKERIKSEEGEDRNALEVIKNYGANLGLGAVRIADNFTKLYETGEGGLATEILNEGFESVYGYAAEHLRNKGYNIPDRILDIDLTTPAMRREMYENHMLDARSKGLSLEEAQKLDPTNKKRFEETIEWFKKHTYTPTDNEGNPVDFIDLVQKGNYLEATDAFLNDAFGAVPSLIVSRLPYGTGAAILGAGAYMDNFESELFERGIDDETTRNQIVKDSFINGSADFTMELVGGRVLNKIIKSGVSKEKAKDLLTNMTKVMATKFGWAATSEGVTEGLTGVTQDLSKNWSYDDVVTGKQLFRTFVKDAALGSFLGGSSTLTSTPSNKDVYDYLGPKVHKQEQLRIEKEIINLTRDSNKSSGSDKDIIESKIKDLKDKKEKNKQNLYDFFDSLTETEKQQYGDNIDGQHKNLNIIGNYKYSESTQEKAKEDYKNFTDANSGFFKGGDINYDSELEQIIGRTLKASERIQEQKGFFGYNKKNLEIEYVDSDSRLKELSEQYKGFNEADGMFVPPSEGGKTKIYINNRVAAFTGQTNVIGHEYLHAIVSRAFSGNINASKLSGSVLSFVDYLKSTGKDGERIIERIEERLANKYEGRDAEGNIIRDSHGLVKTKDKANQEEYFNLFGDIIKNEKIDAVEAKSSGIKNSFRSLIRGFGFGEVDFQSGQEVFDFLVDYNTNTSRESFLGKLTSRGVANVKMKGLESEVSERKVNHTATDSKGNTYTYFANTTEKGGVTTTKFTFNRSDKASTQRNAGGVPTQVALGDKYTIDPEDQYEGFEITKVLEIREGETGASATVRYQDADGNGFNGEVVLVPTTGTKATAADTKDGKFSRSTVNLDEGKGELHEKIDALTNNAKTKAEFQERTKENGRFSAFENVYTGILDGKFDRIFGRNVDESIKEKQRENLADRLINYDPAKTPELSKWMYGGSGKAGNIRYSGLTALHKQWTEDQNKNKLTSIDTEEAKDVIDMTTSAPDADTEANKPDTKDVKLRDLKDFDVYLDDGFGDALAIAEVNGILDKYQNGEISLKEAKSLMNDVTLKDIRAALSESIPKIAQDPIDGKTKPTSEYESWIRSEYNEIVQSLGIRAIRKYPWFKATITGKKDYKNVTEGNVSNYVKPTQINETNKRELFRWFLEGKPGDLRERRTALIRRIAERKASIAVDNKINSDLVQLQIKLKEGTISKTEFDLKTKIITSASELSTTAKLAKDEQLSFDTVKFSNSTAVALVQEVVSNYDKNKPFGPEQALLAGYPQELVTKWEESGLFDFLDVSVKNGFVGPATEADWGIYNDLKDVFINNSTESKVMKDAMAAYAKDRIETLPPQVVRALGKGFFGMGSKRLLDAAKNKKNGTEGPYLWLAELYDDKVSQEDWDVKLPFDPEKLELLNSKSGLMLAIERIQNMELSKAEKVVEVERLQDRIDNANTHNPEFLIWFMEQSAIAMSKNPDLTLGLATQLQSATNNVFAFRAYTRIGMIKLQDGSQAPYLTKDGKPTNDKPTEKNGGDINRNHPDFNRALEYVKVSAGKLQVEVKNFWTDSRKGKKGEALIKLQNKYNTLLESYDFLTSKNGAEITAAALLEYKGEHVDPSANVMLDLFLSTIELAETLSKTPLEKYHKQVIREHRAKYRDILINFDQSLGPKLDSNIQDDILGSTSRFGWARTFAISDQIQHYVETGKWGGIKEVIKAKTQAKLQIIGQRIRIKNAIIDTAVKFSRTASPAKGISVLDFDDTLATTKSGVRYTLPNTSGKPQPKKKVIFMAGGPGSGKSNVINQLGLKEQGFKVVNQDISLEWLMKNHGMPTDMREFTPEQASEFGKLSAEARGIALKKRIKYQGEGDGVVIDGTGASLNVMKKNIQDFKDKGYDVQMIFVETSQETALSRNKARKERSLRTGIVIKTHDSVQANKEAYKELFGERFAEVNTDNLKQGDVMPADVVNKVNDFTSGYIKGRLNAGEYATKGEELRQQGAEFDFSEFNQVVEGKTAPLFNKAMKLQEKFTSKDMFVLTARPAESNQAIFEFLQANGLKIPMENIIGLGSSASSDKALWIAGKVGEGYNDFYFADDILENVQAVSDMLEQFDVKSKVQQAKRDFILGDPKVKKLLDEKSMNDVKDVDGLANPGVYSNVKFSKSHRAEYENTVAKNRPDLSGKEVTATIDKMFDYIDGLDVPNKRKYEQITTKWLATSNIKLPEDSYKIQQAVEIAELKKEDIFSYKNPNEIIEKYAGTIKVKPISPAGIKEFTRATGINDPITTEYGIVEYEVEETREAQQKVRDIVNTHWGPNSNPWCITKIDKDGNLSEDAWRDWTSYGKGPKRIVFQNGKLLAMKANYEYWGKMNKHSEGPIIQVKEGNVTNTTELVVGDGGIVDPIIRETRTVSKDGNTVTTNIFENSQDGYAEGTTIVENRIKGVKTKETRFDPDGSKVSTQEFNKKGKPTTSYQFNPNGKVKSINGHLQQQAITEAGLDVNAREDADIDLTNELVVRVGDIIENNYTETETNGTTTDYFYGRALIGGQVMEIGFESKTGLDLADVTKTIDGKTRLDIGKVIREVDPNVKGLPKTGVKFSKGISKEFNDIIEQSTGVGSEKVFSDAQAKIRGNKRRFDNIVPYSVQDLMGLLYNFVGRGKAGEQHMEFFKKALIDPFARAINELNQSKQSSASDYSNLTKAFPNVKKKLNKEIEGGDYTYDQAIRVYLWNKAGFEVPGLSKRDLNVLDSIVKNDPELQAFADTLGLISKKEEGYAKPGEHWLVENIASDLLSDGSIGDARSEFLAEWQQNADEMFSKENLNKIQAIYGNKFREALEDILYRMKHGTNRPTGSSRLTNNFMNWINNSTGAIMFFNMRSALLQTLSTTNYINWTDNNPLKAAAAFANQKQYWSDFSALFNSDFLKQRRSGNQRSINEAELTTAVANSDNKAKAAIAWLLQKGFLPTQIMDSFAISAGGATFYRNRVNKYIKEGMTPEQAQEKAFLDFQEITEATQQSARPDMISQQQASPLGRWLLSFQNTPMQYARIMNKAARDIVNGRGDQKSNISKIAYYGAIQSIIFASLQTAIFAALGDDEEEEFDKKKQKIIDSMVDGWLAGLGVAGKAIGTIERSIKEYLKQKERGFNSDHAQTIIQLLGFSPPIGSKVRKIYGAIQTEQFNKGVSEKRGLTLDNPAWSSWGNVIEGFTNVPLGRISNKLLNIDNALDSQNQWWERAALLLGWNTWDLGIKDPDIEAARKEVKQDKKDQKPVKKKYSEMTFEEIEAERERRKKAKELKLQSQ